MSGRTFLAGSRSALEAALEREVVSAREADPCAPITVLVGSNLLGTYLKRTLAGRMGGLFNIRFETFTDVVSAIAGREAPVAPLAQLVIVEDIVSSPEVAGRFGEAATTRGFGEALLATFDDLAEAGCTAALARSFSAGTGRSTRLGNLTREVLALYARFRDRVEELGGDAQASFLSALSMSVPPSIGPRVAAYGFYDFNELQLRLLSHLAREREVTVFVPNGEGEVRRFARAAPRLLEERGFAIAAAPAGGVDDTPVTPVLMHAADEEEEVREIARRILALARSTGVRFGEVALLLPSADTYARLAREIFAEAGIPLSLRPDGLAERGPLARSLLALTRMLAGAMERRDLVEFLVSAPLAPSAACGDGIDSRALWVRASAEAGIAGERGWRAESAALVERLRSIAEPDDGDREVLAAAVEVDGLLATIIDARETVRGLASWRDRSAHLSGLIEKLFPESEEREAVRASLEGLAVLDSVSAEPSYEAFARIAQQVLSGGPLRGGTLGGEGINVLSLSQARGLSFRAVFIPGLAERIFPGAARQDPFLADAERRAVNACAAGAVRLSEKSGRMSEEALLFDLARGAAREHLVVSRPRFEGGTGKERIPSSFLRFVDGRVSGASGGEGLPWERVPRGSSPARGAELLSEHELDFRNAAAFLRGDGSLPDNPFFARGSRLVRARYGARSFTPYDGVFSSKRALSELGRMLEDEGLRFAPTYLEAYARCPFDYLLTRVLRVRVLEEPERLVAITPLARGDLVHRILARVFGELRREGLLPVRGAPAEAVDAAAGTVVERFLEEYPRAQPVGLPVFWEMEKRLIRESVRILLDEERSDEGDFVPEAFERSFGRAGDPVDVSYETRGTTVHFRGRIDRLDTAPGGRYRVIDYKTGRLVGRDQDLACGSALQLPIYLLAASRILGADVHAGEARYLHVGAGEGRRSVVFSGSAWDESAPRLAAIIDVITGGIERGVFFAPADEDACRSCDVRPACPPGVRRLFAIKAANDERARPYVAMRGGEEEA